MKTYVGAESFLTGAISIAQRASETLSGCNDCVSIYDLLLGYQEALNAEKGEPDDDEGEVIPLTG